MISARATMQLRFKVGDRVLCCAGFESWAPGTIIALWYRQPSFPHGLCAPYQVRVDGTCAPTFVPVGSNQVRVHGDNNIYVPADADCAVRALTGADEDGHEMAFVALGEQAWAEASGDGEMPAMESGCATAGTWTTSLMAAPLPAAPCWRKPALRL